MFYKAIKIKIKLDLWGWSRLNDNKVTNVQKRERERQREKEGSFLRTMCVLVFLPMITCYRGDVDSRVPIVSAMKHFRKEVHNFETFNLKTSLPVCIAGQKQHYSDITNVLPVWVILHEALYAFAMAKFLNCFNPLWWSGQAKTLTGFPSWTTTTFFLFFCFSVYLSVSRSLRFFPYKAVVLSPLSFML